MKRPATTLWGLIREVIKGDPLTKQNERVEEAIKAKAQKVSDAEFNRTMANFYTERLLGIDPNTDWWEFADAKQKQHDRQAACMEHEAGLAEAAKLVEAETARYVQLHNELCGTGQGGAQ